MTENLLLLHGPNLSQLGARDPDQYGDQTLAELEDMAAAAAAELGATLVADQYEAEGSLVARIHAARTDGTDGIIINAGALTHYSYALRDALEMLDIPVIELHLSNVHAREDFRSTSVIAPVVDGIIAGLGHVGYPLAVRAAVELVRMRA